MASHQCNGNAINKVGHRCESSQGDYYKSSVCHFIAVFKAFQNQSRVSIRGDVTAFSICQLYTIGIEIFQSKFVGLRWIEECVSSVGIDYHSKSKSVELTFLLFLYKHRIPILDFPACIIGDSPPELTSDSLVIGDTAPYSWRNIFSCINLLRILNKLTKWKHSRVMMLVVFKAAPILKRTLKVRHALMQLYVLKLLKMQTKYLGRQWRKTNMKIISAIYEKVRHRLNDDWAFGNGE